MAMTYDAYDDATLNGSLCAEEGSAEYLATISETGPVAKTCVCTSVRYDGNSGWVDLEGDCIERSVDETDRAGLLVVCEYSVSCLLGKEDLDRSS